MDALILQCGGPTPVFNASLAAVIATCQTESCFKQIWGCRQGWQGLIQDDWIELTDLPKTKLDRLRLQPGAALGGGRVHLREPHVPAVLQRMQERQIDAIFVIGGNGSMSGAHELVQAATEAGYQVAGKPLQVIGVPKTVDNDLVGTDCTPGFGSAARLIAQATRDMGIDLYAMRNFDDVAIVEVMGRHVGWLTAATALARKDQDDAPHLILLPEVPLDEERLLEAVRQVYQRLGICFITASEGIRDPQGNFLAEKLAAAEQDESGQRMLTHTAGLLPYLAQLVQRQLGLRCRQIRPDLMQRSSSGMVSAVDRKLAELVGTQAVMATLQGDSGVMMGLERQLDRWHAVPIPFEQVIGQERSLSTEYIEKNQFDVARPFLEYIRPLVGQLALGSVQL